MADWTDEGLTGVTDAQVVDALCAYIRKCQKLLGSTGQPSRSSIVFHAMARWYRDHG
jgi:hypothetical protein